MKSKRFSLPDVDWRAYFAVGMAFGVLAIYAVPDYHLVVGLLIAAVATIVMGHVV